jgi:phosphatidylglycerol:prolipoprotein diacylglycerol transferase
MYPDFRYIARSLFGVEHPWEWLSLFKTFGFFVALAFLSAAYVLIKELKRKEKQGLLIPTFETIEVGKPASVSDLLVSAISGFLVGYKIGGIFTSFAEASPNPMAYIFSLKGNILIGIVGAAVFGYIKYAEKKKLALETPTEKKVAIYPHQRVGEIVLIGAIGGLVGAKLFNAFETWDDFIQNPIGNLISSSGLTFYGGLILATIMFYFFAKKHKIGFVHLCDAAAPALILAYGVGRLGCQFSGDGDWGIYNSAYITDASGHLKAVAMADFQQVLHSSAAYFTHEFKNLASVPHIYANAPGWVPDWLYAMNYPHNVNNEGVLLTGCTGEYCAVLPVGVFPTPLYEAITCILLFFVIWALRGRFSKPFHIFGFYLILNGLERFFVEKIRVNYKYDWGFMHPTQAEIISSCLVIAGVCILLFYKKDNAKMAL